MEISKRDPSQYLVWVVFFAVLGAHLFLAVKWQEQFFIYFFKNSHAFTGAVSRAYQDIINSQSGFPVFYEFHSYGVGDYWPPVVPIIGLWTLLALPAPWFFLPNFFYLAMIMLGIYFSTRILIRNALYSMLAAVIFSCYWFVMIQWVSFEVQLAATACIVWSFYWYLRSCFFTCFWPSLLVGLFMVFALYCDRVTPGLFVFSLFLVPGNFRNKKSWFLMALALVLVAICVWPFYGKWIPNWLGNTRGMAFVFGQGDDSTSSEEAYRTVLHNPRFLWAHLSYYFISLPEKLLGYGFTALLLLGMFFVHRLKKHYAQVLWTALGIPLIVFIGIIKKDPVYIFPLCIYFAMISGMGLYFIRGRWLRYFLILMIVGLSVMQYFLFFDLTLKKERSLLFSEQFEGLCDQRIPKLISEDKYLLLPPKDLKSQAYLVIDQISSVINKRASLGERKQAMIVDLQDYNLQNSVVFLLTINLRKVKVINDIFESPAGEDKDCDEDHLYLLSDKEQYVVEKGRKSSGGCSWKSQEPLYRVPASPITLYRVRR